MLIGLFKDLRVPDVIHRFTFLKYFLAACGLFPLLVGAQTSDPDTLFVEAAANRAKEIYTSFIGSQSHLYNGVQYKEWNLSPADMGNPFFETDDWVEGTVNYDGETHEHAYIIYDIARDKVVIEHGTRGIKLQLIDQKIEGFDLPGHRFKRLTGDSLKGSPIKTGFYELVSDGRAQFFVRWHREYRDVIDDLQIHYIFHDRNSYFIFKNGIYYPVLTRRSVLKVLSENKGLRKFIRKNGLNFGSNRVGSIGKVVSFYNQSAD